MGLASDVGRTREEGLSLFRSTDIDETEEEVKAGAGKVHTIHATNANAAVRYLKLYDGLAADVVVGTTTPKMTLRIPATGYIPFDSELGISFPNGITAAATTGIADNDTGAPSANDVTVHIGYA